MKIIERAELDLFSDEIRERERKRRRREPLWSLLSVLLHLAAVALLVLCTPVKKLVLPERQTGRPPAPELTADRLEELSETLSAARMNELLQQIQAMQAVLHNMDAMKEEIAKDYDAFAAHEAQDARTELEKLVRETGAHQAKSVEAQAIVRDEVRELVKTETTRDLKKNEVSKEICTRRDKLMYETVEKTNTAQANAVNALDRLAVKAAFTGFEATAEAAAKLREAQVEAAKLQDAAQTEAQKIAEQMMQIAGNERFVESEEKAVRTAAEKAERNGARKAENAAKLSKAEPEARKLEAEIAALRAAKKWSEAKERGKALEPVRRECRDAKREVERAEREIAAAAREKKWHEDRVRPAYAQREKLEKIRRECANEKQVAALDRAEDAQRRLNARLKALEATLAADASKLGRLAQEDRREENGMVRREAAGMTLREAYEFAQKLEGQITVSYKDIKSTQTAISHKMSFAEAQKITDVATPARAKAAAAALAETVRTQAALDRRKKAEAEVVREADSMVEATVAMMNEAMKIVMGEEASAGERQQAKGKSIRWLEERDFAKRTGEKSAAERLSEMSASSDYQVELRNAAAEDATAKAKDLAGLMAKTDETFEGPDTKGADDAASDRNGSPDRASAKGGAAGPPSLKAGDLGLVPGNVLRVSPKPGAGVEAEWMYVNSWYVIGPFPNPNRANLRRKFAPESVQDLDATYAGKDGRTLRWRFWQAQSSKPPQPWMADWHAEIIPEGKEEYAIYYAYAEVFLDEACDRWVAIGSDDRSDVWLNDLPIWGSSNRLKEWKLAEDFRRVHFKKGRNRILVRVENGHWNCGWSFCIATHDAKRGGSGRATPE